MNKPELRLLIIGCPRSGTKYAAAYFQKIGHDIGHERVGKDGVSSWMFAATDNTYPWGVGKKTDYNFKMIVHQIRHPLQVISSLSTIHNISWKFIAKHINLNPELNDIQKRMKMWIEWNKLCESQTNFRYRIENFDQAVQRICNNLHISYKPAKIVKNLNARNHIDLSWKQLVDADKQLCKEIISMMSRYGYKKPILE